MQNTQLQKLIEGGDRDGNACADGLRQKSSSEEVQQITSTQGDRKSSEALALR